MAQVWHYDKGEVTHVGVGHSGEITGIKISPDARYIVSVSDDGAIFRWKYPASLFQTTPVAMPTNEGVMTEGKQEVMEQEVGGNTPKQEEE